MKIRSAGSYAGWGVKQTAEDRTGEPTAGWNSSATQEPQNRDEDTSESV